MLNYLKNKLTIRSARPTGSPSAAHQAPPAMDSWSLCSSMVPCRWCSGTHIRPRVCGHGCTGPVPKLLRKNKYSNRNLIQRSLSEIKSYQKKDSNPKCEHFPEKVTLLNQLLKIKNKRKNIVVLTMYDQSVTLGAHCLFHG